MKVARQLLEMQGPFQVDTASSAEEALEKMKKEKYDAVVCDYQMPGKDGLEFLKELRHMGDTVPFIMFTGKGREEVAISALNLGADQYLNKIRNPETVYAELAHAIRQAADRKSAQEAIMESEERYRDLFELAPDATVTLDIKGVVTSCNIATTRISGYSRDEIVGKHISKLPFLRARDIPKYLMMLSSVLRGRVPEPFEVAWHSKDGAPHIAEVLVSLMKKERKIIGIQAMIREVTERKKAEEQIKKTSEEWSRTFDAITDLVFIIDRDYRLVRVNKRVCDVLKKKPEELVGKRCYDVLHGKDTPWPNCPHRRTLETKEATSAEINDPNLGIPLFVTNSPIFDEKGELVQCVHFAKDITERKKAEEKVRESEEKYRELFENAGDVIMTFDLKGNVTSANKAVADYGYRKDELIGESMLKFVSKEYWPTLRSDLEQLAQGRPVRNEIAMITPCGKRTAEYSSNPIVRQSSVIGIQTILRDVTDRKNVEESLRMCNENHEKLFDSAVEGLMISGADDKISSANLAAAKILGYSSPEELGRMEAAELYADPEQRRALWEQLMQKGHVEGFEAVLKRKDDTHVCVQASITLHKDTEGNILRTESVFREVFEHEKVEEELRDLRERLDVLFERAPDAYYMNDLKGTFVAGNKVAEEVTGYSKTELVGKSFLKLKLLPRSQIPKAAKLLVMNALGKPTGPDEFTLNRKDGTQVQVEIRTFPAKIKGKTIVLGIARDVTERRKIEAALRRSEEELRGFASAVKSSRDGIVMSDLDGRITELNDAALRLYGADEKTDLIGKSSLDIVPPEERQRIIENMKEVMTKGYAKSKEINALTKSGARVPVEVTTTLVKDKEGHPIGSLGIIRDLTERKNAERAILESQQEFEGLFIGNPEATVHLDQDFHILDVNPRFTGLFGYSRDEVRGKRLNDVVVPKDRVEEGEMLDGKAREAYVYHETVRAKKDGSLVPVSISAAPIFIQGQLAGYIGVYKDISERKSAEEKLAVMNEKLRVVGGLTRHDVRNKLSTITGNAYLLKKQLAGNSEILDKLKDMEKAVQQTVEIFDFAKAYEMLGVEELIFIDVEKTVNETIPLFSDLKGVKVKNDCHGLSVLADSLLRQLFYNLIDNSLKYGQKTSRIRVHYEKTGQDELKLVYEDDGVGISVAEKPKLFKEGHSTGGSTGYGLYLIRKMIEVYGWVIRETGELGKGAQFTIMIPKTNKNGEENYQVR